MKGTELILATFAREEDLLGAVQAVQKAGGQILDAYSPYAVHGLDSALGWRRSRLPVACFLGGLSGVMLALWFQFWTTAQDWPVNVGGRPWNSWPAFIPVTFECMVLLAGFSLVIAWLFRCQLYPGKKGATPAPRLTDDRFAMVVLDPAVAADSQMIKKVLREWHAIDVDVRSNGGNT
jgi:hypothetical protein